MSWNRPLFRISKHPRHDLGIVIIKLGRGPLDAEVKLRSDAGDRGRCRVWGAESAGEAVSEAEAHARRLTRLDWSMEEWVRLADDPRRRGR